MTTVNSLVAPEVAALFNPAFMGLVARRAVEGATIEGSNGLPLELVIVSSGIAVAQDLRQSLTMTTATHFTSWLVANPEVGVLSAQRIAAIAPLARAGILFALQHDLVVLEGSNLVLGEHGPTKKVSASSSEVANIQKAAIYLGRWLSRQGKPSYVLALLGVTP